MFSQRAAPTGAKNDVASAVTNERLAIYQEFLQFIGTDVQKERRLTNRRMFNVFLWCFLLPVVSWIGFAVLIRLHAVQRSRGQYLDWLILFFPICYSLYVLSFEVLTELPGAFRRGGLASSLTQAIKEGAWRARVCESLQKEVRATPAQWNWIAANFEIDLENFRYRNRYMTAFSGAVFFLLLQGVDSLDSPAVEIKAPSSYILSWFASSSYNFSQFVALGLFLILFYVAGNQSYHSLLRYLKCVDLIRGDVAGGGSGSSGSSALRSVE